MRYAVGTSTSVMKVANSTPNASETAIGTRNAAWKLWLNMSGANPAKVVKGEAVVPRSEGGASAAVPPETDSTWKRISRVFTGKA